MPPRSTFTHRDVYNPESIPDTGVYIAAMGRRSRDRILKSRALSCLALSPSTPPMRILSPASDVQTLAPLPLEMRNTEPNIKEETPTTSTTAPSIATVPTVVLDTDVVSDYMAARLCTSFLSHVLFLKNQTPFPIVQLARMPTGDDTSRAAKKRYELLNSFDTLASHLYTTFIALSTALALKGMPEKAGATGQHYGLSRAFFVVALGPTVGTAKSRVLVGIDGLETRVWGLRKEAIIEDDASDTTSDTDDEDSSEQDNGEECGSEYDSQSDDDASPPPSRSPSPVPSSSDSDSSPSTSPPNVPERTFSSPAENLETTRAAERLLSRTLASACAEEGGQGLAAEMAPTQIHVLLRAPRRFDHPAWIPRQNLCASLDGYLADFLIESGHALASSDTTPKKRAKANKVQGVWIKSSGSSTQTECTEDDLAEEDELIWWSWDGKLVGFADW